MPYYISPLKKSAIWYGIPSCISPSEKPPEHGSERARYAIPRKTNRSLWKNLPESHSSKIPRFHVSRRHETFIPFPPASAPCSMSPLQNAPCGTGCILRPDKSPALAEDAKKRPASIGKHHCAGPRFLPVFRSGNLPGGQPCRPVPQSFQHPVAVPLQPPAAEPYLSGHGGKADRKTGQIPAVGSQPQCIREKIREPITDWET